MRCSSTLASSARPWPGPRRPLGHGRLIAVDVWEDDALRALLLLAALQMLPKDYYDAAQVDGASTWTQFFAITVPLMKPALAVAAIFRALDAMRIFDLVYVLTGSNRETMTMAVYARQQLIDFQDFGAGSAHPRCSSWSSPWSPRSISWR